MAKNGDLSTSPVTETIIVTNDTDEQCHDKGRESNSQILRKKILKFTTAFILLGILIFVIVDACTERRVTDFFMKFLESIENNPILGIFGFILIYFVGTVLFIPASVLTLGSAFIFSEAFGLGMGVLITTIAVFVGSVLGSIVTFFIGRFLLQNWVRSKMHQYPKFNAITCALETKGLLVMTLLRLSPVVPYNMIGYLAGAATVTFSAYTISLIAILPGTALYSYIGATASSLLDSCERAESNQLRNISLGVGFFFGFAAVGVSAYFANKEIQKLSDENKGNCGCEDTHAIEEGNTEIKRKSTDMTTDLSQASSDSETNSIDSSGLRNIIEDNCRK